MVHKDEEIYKLNDEIKSLDTSSLTTLADTNSSTLEIFSNRISSVTDSSSDDNWKDDVKSGVDGAISKIGEAIDKVITSCSYIKNAKALIDNLKTICSQYVAEYDKYDSMGNPPPEYIKEKNKKGIFNYVKNEDYAKYMTRKRAFEESLPKLADEAHRLEKAVKNYFQAVDLSTNTVDSSIYVEGSGYIQYDYQQYFDGRMEIEFDDWSSPPTITETYDEESQTVLQHKEGEHSEKFANGASIETHREEDTTYSDDDGNGKLSDEDTETNKKITEEGTFTTEDGKELDYTHSEETDALGTVNSDTKTSDRETGEVVYKSEEERLTAYTDGFGIQHVNGEEITSQNGVVTHTRRKQFSAGENSGEEYYSYSQNTSDPECGEYVDSDGRKYVYYKNDGVLYEKEIEYYLDKDGNQVERVWSDQPHEPTYATLTITKTVDGNATLVGEPIRYDVGSQRDMAMIRSYVESGAIDCQYTGDILMAHLDTDDGITIYGAGQEYNYQLSYDQ